MEHIRLLVVSEIHDCIVEGYIADKDNILKVHTSNAETIEECAAFNVSKMLEAYVWSQVEFYKTEIGFFCLAYSLHTGCNDLYLFYVYPEYRHRKKEQLDLVVELSDLPIYAALPHKNIKCNRFFKKHCVDTHETEHVTVYLLSKKDK